MKFLTEIKCVVKTMTALIPVLLAAFLLLTSCLSGPRLFDEPDGNSLNVESDAESVSITDEQSEPSFKEYIIGDMRFSVPSSMIHESGNISDGSPFGAGSGYHDFYSRDGALKVRFVRIEKLLLSAPQSTADSLFEALRETPSRIMSEGVVINDRYWNFAEISDEDRKGGDDGAAQPRTFVYSYCDGYTQYVVQFLCYSGSIEDHYGDIMPNVFISHGNELDSDTLLGEWDAGDGGYLVFSHGRLEWFSDKSKDKDNVLTADYKVFDKTPEKAAEKPGGNYFVVMRYDTNVIEGERMDVDYVREYYFHISGNSASAVSIFNSSEYEMVRIK